MRVHSGPVRATKWRLAYVRDLVVLALPWRTSQPAGLRLGYSDVGGGFIQCILPNPEMTAFSIPTNNDSAVFDGFCSKKMRGMYDAI